MFSCPMFATMTAAFGAIFSKVNLTVQSYLTCAPGHSSNKHRSIEDKSFPCATIRANTTCKGLIDGLYAAHSIDHPTNVPPQLALIAIPARDEL